MKVPISGKLSYPCRLWAAKPVRKFSCAWRSTSRPFWPGQGSEAANFSCAEVLLPASRGWNEPQTRPGLGDHHPIPFRLWKRKRKTFQIHCLGINNNAVLWSTSSCPQPAGRGSRLEPSTTMWEALKLWCRKLIMMDFSKIISWWPERDTTYPRYSMYL